MKKAEEDGRKIDIFRLDPGQKLFGIRALEDSKIVRALGFMAWSFPLKELF